MKIKFIEDYRKTIDDSQRDKLLIVLSHAVATKCLKGNKFRVNKGSKPVDMVYVGDNVRSNRISIDMMEINSKVLGNICLDNNILVSKGIFDYYMGDYGTVLKDYIMVTSNKILRGVERINRESILMPNGVLVSKMPYTQDDVDLFIQSRCMSVDKSTNMVLWDYENGFTGNSVFGLLIKPCKDKEMYFYDGMFYRDISKHPMNIVKEVYILIDNFEKTDRQRAKIAQKKKDMATRSAKYNENRLPLGYETDCDSDGNLKVRCYNHKCKKMFKPTNKELSSCLASQNNSTGSVQLYCSDKCKDKCPVYNKSTSSIIKSDGLIAKTNRPVTSQWVREQVLQRDEFQCSKCGSLDDLHVHHIVGATRCPSQADDIENMTVLCESCHRLLHGQSGCTYSDYRI